MDQFKYKCLLCGTPHENQDLKVGDEGQCTKCGLKFIIVKGEIPDKDDENFYDFSDEWSWF